MAVIEAKAPKPSIVGVVASEKIAGVGSHPPGPSSIQPGAPIEKVLFGPPPPTRGPEEVKVNPEAVQTTSGPAPRVSGLVMVGIEAAGIAAKSPVLATTVGDEIETVVARAEFALFSNAAPVKVTVPDNGAALALATEATAATVSSVLLSMFMLFVMVGDGALHPWRCAPDPCRGLR